MSYNSKLCGTSCHGRWITDAGEPGLVSVILPSYNRAVFLVQAMDSVLAQTYRPMEMVVVDDGSTDGTQAAIRKWADQVQNEPKFEVVCLHQENKGPSAARNFGIIQSRGEFIQHLDSDDVLLPEKVAQSVQSLANSDADYAYSLVLLVDEAMNRLGGHFGEAGVGDDNDVTTYLWQTMAPLFRRKVIAGAGPWREDLYDGDEWEYGARVKLLGFRAKFDPTPGGLHRVHEFDRMRTVEQQIRECDKHEKGYDHVLNLAKGLGRLSPTIRMRMARRYFMTAVQYGCYGLGAKRRRCLEKALALECGLNTVHLLAWFLRPVGSRAVCLLLRRLLYARLGLRIRPTTAVA